MNSGRLVVISGFSGAGKGTIMKELTKRYPDYALSVSATTRKPRPGEEHGREYFFITVEEFRQMIEKDELVEYAQYVENYYGTPKNYVNEKLSLGYNVLLKIEIQGALKIKEKFPDALLIFVTTKDAETLISRLKGRGTEDNETIMKRLKRATKEADGVENYDYIVINDDLKETVETIDRLIKLSNNISRCKLGLIDDIKQELIASTEGE